VSTAAVIDRSLYAALRDHVYLNQASLGLIPRPAVEAMRQFIESTGQFGNIHLSDAAEAGILDELRAAAAQLLDAPSRSVAVVSGASEGLGQVAAALAPEVEEAVLVRTDFPSVTYPWLGVRERYGTAVRWVEDRPDTDLTAALVDAMSGRPSVVCVSAVQYATGSAIDVASLCAAAHAANAKVVVDVTQLAGAGPVSMQEWGADALVCSGYKWLSAHGGVALLAVTDHLTHVTPRILGWMGTGAPFDFDAERLRLSDDARRYQLSTMSYCSAVGLNSSLALLEGVGMVTLAGHARTLAEELVARAAPLGWLPYRSLEQSSASGHLVSLRHERLPAHGVQRALAVDHRIYVSSRGGGIRVSLHGYNDSDDLSALIEALAA
jgi:cysteine desulfurase / selenocysteine lyase